jgi:type III secretion protein U
VSNSDTAEERSLPASPKKLKDLRKKGQIPRSTDMVAGASTSAALIFIWLTGDQFIQRFKLAIIDIVKTDTSSFGSAVAKISRTLAVTLGSYLALLGVLAVSVTILVNLLVNRGFLFSLYPLKLDFSKLNPIEGFQRIFSVKTLVELVKDIFKLSIFLLISAAVLAYHLNLPFYVPFCGTDCFRTTLSSLLMPILMSAIILFLAFGVLDIGIQRWIFLRQQKMTRSEAKRERKHEEGSPEVRKYQQRIRLRILQKSSKNSLPDATIFIEGADVIVGVRFVRGETPVPVVVCKGKGRQFSEILAFAIDNKTPTYADDQLAEGLFQKVEVGSVLTEAFFEPFIKALHALRLV